MALCVAAVHHVIQKKFVFIMLDSQIYRVDVIGVELNCDRNNGIVHRQLHALQCFDEAVFHNDDGILEAAQKSVLYAVRRCSVRDTRWEEIFCQKTSFIISSSAIRSDTTTT